MSTVDYELRRNRHVAPQNEVHFFFVGYLEKLKYHE